jgi:C_GCAxxG_C_C family probable redox protein
MDEKILNKIKNDVHKYYYEQDLNCAGTSLYILCDIFRVSLARQAKDAAVGLHGAGGYRAQCGLIEGPLMFIGIYFSRKNTSKETIAKYCCGFASSFEKKFGSLSCYYLRPQGFNIDDTPHMCEDLTVRAICHSYNFINDILKQRENICR